MEKELGGEEDRLEEELALGCLADEGVRVRSEEEKVINGLGLGLGDKGVRLEEEEIEEGDRSEENVMDRLGLGDEGVRLEEEQVEEGVRAEEKEMEVGDEEKKEDIGLGDEAVRFEQKEGDDEGRISSDKEEDESGMGSSIVTKVGK